MSRFEHKKQQKIFKWFDCVKDGVCFHFENVLNNI